MRCSVRIVTHLHGQGGKDGLRVDERRVAEVVEAALLEDLRRVRWVCCA